MSRREVREAQGTEASAAERLAQKRAELREAERALADAEMRMDVPAVVRLQNEAAVLRKFVSRLQVEAASGAEGEARHEAGTVIAALRQAYRDHLSVLDAAAEDARKAIRAATLVARTCYSHWNDAARARHEIGLLELRFGLCGIGQLAPLPEAPNVAVAVFDEEVAGTTLLRLRPPTVVRRVSDTPDERRAAELEAVGKYLRKHLGALSPAVRSLFEKAPVPDLAPPESVEQRERRERREAQQVRATAEMAQYAQETKQALAATDTRDTPAQKEARIAKRRQVVREQAQTVKRMGDEATRLQDAPPSGGPIKGPLTGMRG